MVALVLTSAYGWTLETTATWPSPTHFGIALADEAGQPILATVNGTELTVLDPITNTTLASSPIAGFGVAWAPASDHLIVCSATGTYAVAWDGSVLGEPALLTSTPCDTAMPGAQDVATHSSGGNAPIYRTDATASTPTAFTTATFTLQDDVLFIVSGTQAISETGEIYIYPALPNHLAWGAGQLWADLGSLLLNDVGEELPLAKMLSADVDGDGQDDLVMSRPDGELAVLSSLDGIVHSLPDSIEPTYKMAQASIGGSDCATVVLLQEDAYTVMSPAGCHGDADGDGFTSEEGDCDDGDPTRNPQATEQCDGVDDDCDGDILDILIEIPNSVTADEGAWFEIPLSLCDEVGPFTYTSHVDDCRVEEWGVACAFLDDGEDTLRIWFGDDSSAAYEVSVEIRNVAPEILNTSILFSPGTYNEAPIEVFDPGELDVHHFELLEGPEWFTLSDGGILSGEVPNRPNAYELMIRVSDEDGGSTEVTLIVEATLPSQGDGCGDSQCSVTGLMPMGLATWAVAFFYRRRRYGKG